MTNKVHIFTILLASTLLSCNSKEEVVQLSKDIVYSTFIGGSGTDDCDAITVDDDGSMYLGCHASSEKLSDDDKHNFQNQGGMDAFVIKVNPSGSTIEFISHLGGNKWDGIQGLVTAEDGSIYAIGTSYSDNFPVTLNAEQTGFGGKSDGFLVKLDKRGVVKWSTFIGGSGDEDGRGLVLDNRGNINIVGRTDSRDFKVTADSIQPNIGGLTDAFVATYSPAGKLLYSSYFGGSDDDKGFGIATTSDNRIIFTGNTKSTNFPIKSALNTEHSGGEDVFIVSIDKNLELEFSTFVGGLGNDRGIAIEIDNQNKAYLVGHSYSPDLKTTEGSLQNKLNGQSDILLMKLNLNTNQVEFLTYLGGYGEDRPRDMEIGVDGRISIVGQTNSSDLLNNIGVNKNNLEYDKGFVIQINNTGNQILASHVIGGSKTDVFEGLAYNNLGEMVISGLSQSKDFQTRHPIQSRFHGGRFDIVLLKIKGS
jgi:hypothetical protein